jgi:hypothetical protein
MIKIQNPKKHQTAAVKSKFRFRSFEHSDLEFVSDFDIRYSDFYFHSCTGVLFYGVVQL